MYNDLLRFSAFKKKKKISIYFYVRKILGTSLVRYVSHIIGLEIRRLIYYFTPGHSILLNGLDSTSYYNMRIGSI